MVGDVEDFAVNSTGIVVTGSEAEEKVAQTAWICSVDLEAHRVDNVRCAGCEWIWASSSRAAELFGMLASSL